MSIGALGLLWYVHWLQSDPKFDTVLFGTAITISVATTAGALKVHLRFRKLTTLLHRHARSPLRALEDIQEGSGDSDRVSLRSAARRSWDALQEVLATNIDTGFKNGIFVLPPASVQAVEQVIMAAVEASDRDGADFQAAVDTLMAIQAACVGRLDPVT